MNDHWPTGSGSAGLAELEARNARRKALVALTALKRLESERDLQTHESTRDQVRRALEGAGILFIESDRGRGVMLLHDANDEMAKGPSRQRPHIGV